MLSLARAQDRLDWLVNFNEDTRRMFETQLNHLITEAKRAGIILDINVVPARPAAMGNYMVMGRAYLARPAYVEIMALEERVKELKEQGDGT